MRNHQDMHDFLWEAIETQASDMVSRGLMPKEFGEDVDFITKARIRNKGWNTILRMMACRVEAQMLPKEAEWSRIVNEEHEELNREIEMSERNQRLQQGISQGGGLSGFGA